jgi:translocation protein SEC63
MGEETNHTGSSPMFLIFVFSIYSLVLIPFTLYKLCGGGSGSEEGVVKTWADKKKKHHFGEKVKGAFNRVGFKLLLAWALYLLLFWCVPAGVLVWV